MNAYLASLDGLNLLISFDVRGDRLTAERVPVL